MIARKTHGENECLPVRVNPVNGGLSRGFIMQWMDGWMDGKTMRFVKLPRALKDSESRDVKHP